MLKEQLLSVPNFPINGSSAAPIISHFAFSPQLLLLSTCFECRQKIGQFFLHRAARKQDSQFVCIRYLNESLKQLFLYWTIKKQIPQITKAGANRKRLVCSRWAAASVGLYRRTFNNISLLISVLLIWNADVCWRWPSSLHLVLNVIGLPGLTNDTDFS